MKQILSLLVIILISVPSFSYANKMNKQEKKDFDNHVLRAQSKSKMEFNSRNVPHRTGLYKFFDNCNQL